MVTEPLHGYKKTDHGAILAVVERTLQRAVHPLILMCDGMGDSDGAASHSHAQSVLQFRRFHPRLAHIAGLAHHIPLGKEGKDFQQNVAVFDVGEAHSSLAMRCLLSALICHKEESSTGASIAQLVEHPLRKRQVVCSNPTWGFPFCLIHLCVPHSSLLFSMDSDCVIDLVLFSLPLSS